MIWLHKKHGVVWIFIFYTCAFLPLPANNNDSEIAKRLQQGDNFTEAIRLYHEILKKNPHDIASLYSLSNCFLSSGQYKQAEKLYTFLHRLQPNDTNFLYSFGLCFKKQNKMHEAIPIFQKALEIIQNNVSINESKMFYAQIQRGISGAYLALGDFKNGWPAYEYRWANPPAYIQHFKQYITHNNSLKGKHILLKTEYGLGDTLQFIRYAHSLKKCGAQIIVESQPELIPLLKNCWYIDTLFPSGLSSEGYDLSALLMSMPLIMETTLDTIPTPIPYLFADTQLIDYWADRIAHDSHFKIGLCWQANMHIDSKNFLAKKNSQEKSIPLDKLAPLAEIKNISFYSLQKITGTQQLQSIPAHFIIHHFDDMDTTHGSFMDTAALIKNLDLVITIDTSIAHLAGALGASVWLLLPYYADWRWMLDRTDSPWYPTMRLFRQPTPGDWQAVIQDMANALQKIRAS